MMASHAKWSFRESVKRIRDGQNRGEIGTHASAEELATSLMCIMRGLALTTLVGHGVALTPPGVETVMRLLLPIRALAAVEPDGGAPVVPGSGLVSIPRAAATRALRARSLPKKTARKATR